MPGYLKFVRDVPVIKERLFLTVVINGTFFE